MKEIKRVSVTDQCIQTIKQDIVNGEYSIGEKLPTENDLCNLLNVSRSTLREAYRVLQAMGYVNIIHGKGAFVISQTEKDNNKAGKWFASNNTEISDVIKLRRTLEECTVAHATEKATEIDLEKLKNIHEQMIQAANVHSIMELVDCDERFHETIVRISGNAFFESVNSQITDALREYRINIFSMKNYYASAIEPHSAIIRAIETKDVEKAKTAMNEHINYIVSDIANAADIG